MSELDLSAIVKGMDAALPPVSGECPECGSRATCSHSVAPEHLPECTRTHHADPCDCPLAASPSVEEWEEAARFPWKNGQPDHINAADWCDELATAGAIDFGFNEDGVRWLHLAARALRQQGGVDNTPIADLMAEYTAEDCDFTNLARVREMAQRVVQTMPDSQARCLLHALSAPAAPAATTAEREDDKDRLGYITGDPWKDLDIALGFALCHSDFASTRNAIKEIQKQVVTARALRSQGAAKVTEEMVTAAHEMFANGHGSERDRMRAALTAALREDE